MLGFDVGGPALQPTALGTTFWSSCQFDSKLSTDYHLVGEEDRTRIKWIPALLGDNPALSL